MMGFYLRKTGLTSPRGARAESYRIALQVSPHESQRDFQSSLINAKDKIFVRIREIRGDNAGFA